MLFTRNRKKYLTAFLCVAGVSALSYGMARDNHPIFIIGLLLIITGYLVIRKKLKDSAQDKP